MTKIAFRGRDDFRELAAADLGVEGFRKTSFARGEEVEVNEAVATELLSNPDKYGKFEAVTTPAAEDTAKKK